MIERLLGELVAPVDAIHGLQRARCVRAPALAEALGEPLHEGRRLFRETEPQQAVERKGGVPDPRIAVVPVARAAQLLRQTGRRSCHDRTGRLVGEELQRERGAVDHLAPTPAVA